MLAKQHENNDIIKILQDESKNNKVNWGLKGTSHTASNIKLNEAVIIEDNQPEEQKHKNVIACRTGEGTNKIKAREKYLDD